jgi:hypothetical protein
MPGTGSYPNLPTGPRNATLQAQPRPSSRLVMMEQHDQLFIALYGERHVIVSPPMLGHWRAHDNGVHNFGAWALTSRGAFG